MHKAAAHAKRGLPLRHLPAMDLPFLVLVLTLVGFGLVMLGSASSAVALYRRGDAFAYLRPQLLYAALGIGAMWVASRVDYHIYHKLAWPLLALSMVLLTAVLFMPEYNGCKRWLVLPGLGTLQPSEIAKFAVVLVFAHIIALNHDRMGSFAVGVVPFALVLGVVAVLMLLEPHLSGTVLILSIGAVLMFVGGTGLRWFMLAGAGGAAAIGQRHHRHLRARGIRLQNGAGSVGGPVVDHNNLYPAGGLLRQHAVDTRRHIRRGVVGGNHHRHIHRPISGCAGGVSWIASTARRAA